MHIRLNSLRWSAASLLLVALLRAQEEPDRPAGEVTKEMLGRSVPKSWVGAGDAPGMSQAEYKASAGVPLPNLIPLPQEIYPGDHYVSLGATGSYSLGFELRGEAKRLGLLESELRKRLTRRFDASPARKTMGAAPRLVFTLDPWHVPLAREKLAKRFATLKHPEAYIISTEKADGQDVVVVLGKTERALWRAMATLAQLVMRREANLVLPAVEIIDYPQADQRALITDIGGQGFMVGPAAWNFSQWKDFIDWMVDQKFNEIWFEIIGSGRLMGALNPAKGEWIGFPMELQSYPQLVCRDRPIRRWDEAKGQIVDDKYTAPNVRQEFLRELIDYTQARGMKAVVFAGYDYFANQLPFTLGVPANDPSHPEANRVYDKILREIVERYSNAQGVIIHTIENKNVPPEMVDHVVRRTHEARAIVKAINPEMDFGILNDYLEWRPREEFDRYSAGLPADVYQVYSPHSAPLEKAWLRTLGGVFRYQMLTQYAWNHGVYIFPQRIQREFQGDMINGYRKFVSQAWYAGVFKMNFLAMAEMSWNSTGRPLDQFWNGALESVFGTEAAPKMREAFAHTRFDRRIDIVGRMLLREKPESPFQFWDMYKMTNFDTLSESMLDELEADATKSLGAAQAALPLVVPAEARAMVDETIVSAQRRIYIATSARHYLRARAALAQGDRRKALAEIERCLAEGEKLLRAAARLGLEFPMATNDDEVVERYQTFRTQLLDADR